MATPTLSGWRQQYGGNWGTQAKDLSADTGASGFGLKNIDSILGQGGTMDDVRYALGEARKAGVTIGGQVDPLMRFNYGLKPGASWEDAKSYHDTGRVGSNKVGFGYGDFVNELSNVVPKPGSSHLMTHADKYSKNIMNALIDQADARGIETGGWIRGRYGRPVGSKNPNAIKATTQTTRPTTTTKKTTTPATKKTTTPVTKKTTTTTPKDPDAYKGTNPKNIRPKNFKDFKRLRSAAKKAGTWKKGKDTPNWHTFYKTMLRRGRGGSRFTSKTSSRNQWLPSMQQLRDLDEKYTTGKRDKGTGYVNRKNTAKASRYWRWNEGLSDMVDKLREERGISDRNIKEQRTRSSRRRSKRTRRSQLRDLRDSRNWPKMRTY